MPVLGAVISGGTSIIGGLLGSSGAKNAAKTQAAAGEAVARSIDKSTGQAIDAGYNGITESQEAINNGTAAANQGITNAGAAQRDIYGNLTAGINPYQGAGLQGLNSLQNTAGTFKFDATDLQNDPGYQFQLQQGMKALQSSAATRGMLQSGSTMKALANYSQGLASTDYQNAYNRALTTFNTNQSGFQNLANLGTTANSQAISAGGTYGGQLGSLASLAANTNMQGAGLLSNTAMQGNEYIGNIGLKGAEDAGNVRIGGANATAAGQMGSANAWAGALNSIGNTAMTLGMSGQGGSGGGGGGGFTPYSQGTPWNPANSMPAPPSVSYNPGAYSGLSSLAGLATLPGAPAI